MTTQTTTQNIILKSSMGDTYSIPENMKDQFMRLDGAIQELLLGDEDWFQAIDDFNYVFSTYIRG
jgi:hypothetical protein